MRILKAGILIVLVLVFGITAAHAEQEDLWKHEVALGYNQKTGNTQTQQLDASYEGTQVTEEAELTIKATTLYSSQNKKMDGQKHTGSARYAPNLGDTDWFYFGKTEAEHDKFAGIDYRITPSIGLGRWIQKDDEMKLSAEVGVGHEFIEYNNGSNDDATVLIPRGYFEKPLFTKSTISEELILYPSLEDGKKYRIRSETKFTNPLSDDISLRISFIDEFNTDPLGDAKKNDTQFILSLVYTL